MPLNLNRVEIAGTMTRDAEVKYTPKGTAVAQVSLAVNRQWKDEAGNKHEEVEFFDCEAWGKTAEIIGEYCGKGHCILIDGRLKTDKWKDKDTGKDRSKIKIVIEKMHFVSKPRDKSEGEQRQEKPSHREERPASRPKPPKDPDLDAQESDSIPF